MFLRRFLYYFIPVVFILLIFVAMGCQTGSVTNQEPTTASPDENLVQIALPPPNVSGNMTLEQAIHDRRSIRNFREEEVPLESIGQILWAAQGITDKASGFRSAPSAGALYPLEIYLIAGQVDGLSPGIYRYVPINHHLVQVAGGDRREQIFAAALNQQVVLDAPASIFIAAVHSRTEAVYGSRAKIYVYLEAGHVGQNISLQAIALGLGSVPIGAFQDQEIKRAIGLKDDESPIYLIPIGYPENAD